MAIHALGPRPADPDIDNRRGERAPISPGVSTNVLWLLGSRFGWKGLLVGLLLMAVVSGINMFSGGQSGGDSSQTARPAAEEETRSSISSRSSWTTRRRRGARSCPSVASITGMPSMLFTDAVQSSCGMGQSATGPFYCPADEHVYVNLGFFRELDKKFGAPGDFAQAYVIAHEIGHHVQKVLGLTERGQRGAKGETGASVRLELQADCFAGIWAHGTLRRDLLEPGDIAEGLTAAAAVGDDRLQREATGKVQPERWTHGSSEQRERWFNRGFESGKLDACDTFDSDKL